MLRQQRDTIAYRQTPSTPCWLAVWMVSECNKTSEYVVCLHYRKKDTKILSVTESIGSKQTKAVNLLTGKFNVSLPDSSFSLACIDWAVSSQSWALIFLRKDFKSSSWRSSRGSRFLSSLYFWSMLVISFQRSSEALYLPWSRSTLGPTEPKAVLCKGRLKSSDWLYFQQAGHHKSCCSTEMLVNFQVLG